jgi:hypothetical protein
MYKQNAEKKTWAQQLTEKLQNFNCSPKYYKASNIKENEFGGG